MHSDFIDFDPSYCSNERDVESKLIVQYLLPKLGYSQDSWHQQVVFKPGFRLDFVAFFKKITRSTIEQESSFYGIVIEAKHPNEDVDDHTLQLKKYLKELMGRSVY
ncbi:MAG: hypothetical protein HC799_19705 [Limnothrix sp. RL_2_0]|nr:hypothetical protein [Limnothrix sp. RL_2_0]